MPTPDEIYKAALQGIQKGVEKARAEGADVGEPFGLVVTPSKAKEAQ